MNIRTLTVLVFAAVLTIGSHAHAESEPRRGLYWGDTHVHTSYSVDAFFLGNRRADPDTAYRFAKGQPVMHPATGMRVQMDRPLDFLVVADHAEQLGVGLRLAQGDPLVADTPTGRSFIELLKAGRGAEVFRRIVSAGASGETLSDLHSEPLREASWHEITAAADRHNVPGRFTAFIGWEWSSLVDAANLHRVIFTPDDAAVANQFLPFSSIESTRPEDLWAWLAQTSERTGADFIAIPHNSNLSKGQMFATVDSEGRPLTSAWAEARSRWEPVVEVTQTKGDSETHPALSPNDEFADFAFFPSLIDTRRGVDRTPTVTDGDYVRGALKRGLALERELGVNPYQFGLIGATDIHTGLADVDEVDYTGVGGNDYGPEQKTGRALPGVTGWSMSSAGLSAVWADENSRRAIADAFLRREVYGTTGTRLKLRVFGGWRFTERDARRGDLAAIGYRKGVPMGGELTTAPRRGAPTFLLHAAKDPAGANLDRVQIVKGWIDARGNAHERVYEALWAGEREPASDGRLPPLGNTVDTTSGTYTNSIGATELAGVWRDPAFDPALASFYYVRVLEIPTPRHSLLDAIALQMAPDETGAPATLQERAYSSPIWYKPVAVDADE